MMKKIITLILIALVAIVSIYGGVYATDDLSAELIFTSGVEIEEGTENVTLTLTLASIAGDTTEFANYTTSCLVTVTYDNTIFSSVSCTGLNEWSVDPVTSDETSSSYEITSSSASVGTSIAQFVFTLEDGVEAGNTTVSLTGSIYTGDGQDNDIVDDTFTATSTITITEASTGSEGGNTNTNSNSASTSGTNNTVNNTTNNTTNSTTTNSNNDSTTSSSSLPSTGAGTVAIIMILIVIVGIGCYIRYKSIQTK